MEVLATIVIPVYNGEKYIARAILSAQKQTMKEVEIAVVDDGSTDGTAETVIRIAAQDDRVKLLRHDCNRGLLMARKTGTLQAGGRYIVHLDADDELMPDACERLVQAMRGSGAQMIHFSAEYRFPEGYRPVAALDEIIAAEELGEGAWEGNLPGTELLERFFIRKRLHWSTWSMFCEAGLAKRVFGMLGNERCDIAEDALTTFLLLANAERVGYLGASLYRYYLGIGITSELTPRKARAVASEYRVYTLLDECLTEAQRQDEAVRDALGALHDDLLDAVFWNLLHIEDGGILDEMTAALARCCPADVFYRELQLYFRREQGRQAERHAAQVVEQLAQMRGEWEQAEKRYLGDIAQLQTEIERLKRESEQTETHYLDDIAQLQTEIERLKRESEQTETHYLGDIAQLQTEIERLKRESEQTETHYLDDIAQLQTEIERLNRQSEQEHRQWAVSEEHALADIAQLKAEIEQLCLQRDELERRLNESLLTKMKNRLKSIRGEDSP